MFKHTVRSALSNKWCYVFQRWFQGQKTMQYALFPLELSLLSVPQLLNISITWIEHSHGFLCPADASGALDSAAAPDWRNVSPPLHSHTSPWSLTSLPGSPHTESNNNKKEREWECRNLSEKAMSLVNNTHCVCPGARSFFRSRALFCDIPANESQLYFLSLSTRMGITSFCSSLILLLLCSSWLVALWCSSCRTLSWFSRSVCVFSRVLTVLLRLVFCFLELWAGCRFRFQRDYIIGLQKELFSYLKVKCRAGY